MEIPLILSLIILSFKFDTVAPLMLYRAKGFFENIICKGRNSFLPYIYIHFFKIFGI
jgi:hypothetical protein